MKLLLHACCGPCSIMPTRLLRADGHDFDVFYANSNIAPRDEYEKRLAELVRFGEDESFQVIEGRYDPSKWEQSVAPFAHAEEMSEAERKERCRACYRMRLEEAAKYAKEHGYDGLASTLAVSPYQFSDVLDEELHRACAKTGVAAHFQDYRPYYREATRISRELGMYRQNYCGCRFSVKEAEKTRALIKEQRAAEKAARAVERAKQEARLKAERQKRQAEKQAYAQKRAQRRALRKALAEKRP